MLAFLFKLFVSLCFQSLKKKITTYRRAASHYDKEERNGTETSEPAETLGTNDEGDEGKRKMRVRRRRNETNGHAAKDEDKDEGLCLTCHIILSLVILRLLECVDISNCTMAQFWLLKGCLGTWVKIRSQNSPIVQFDTTPTQSQFSRVLSLLNPSFGGCLQSSHGGRIILEGG